MGRISILPPPAQGNGASAYELYLATTTDEVPFTLEEWLANLHGGNGNDGSNGENGASAYDLFVVTNYLENPEEAPSIEEWLSSLSGEVEIGYVVNETTVVQASPAAGVYADVNGLSIVVPPQARPVWIEWGFYVDITTAPAAATTSNIDSYVFDQADNILGAQSIIVGPNGVLGNPTVLGRCRVGPNVAEKTYRIRWTKSGNATFTGNIYHGSIHSAFRSWMAAILR